MTAALLFAFAPLPNWLCGRCSGADDFSADYSSGPVDFGHFLTSCFLVSGVALPYVLAHAEVIHPAAGWMSALGGLVGYATGQSRTLFRVARTRVLTLRAWTVITYSHFFAIRIDEF